MTKLAALPDKKIIDSLKGVLDFYVYLGIPCVRTWPRYDPRRYPPTVIPPQDDFRYINQAVAELPDYIIAAYKEQAGGTRLAWKDVAVRCYLAGHEV